MHKIPVGDIVAKRRIGQRRDVGEKPAAVQAGVAVLSDLERAFGDFSNARDGKWRGNHKHARSALLQSGDRTANNALRQIVRARGHVEIERREIPFRIKRSHQAHLSIRERNLLAGHRNGFRRPQSKTAVVCGCRSSVNRNLAG